MSGYVTAPGSHKLEMVELEFDLQMHPLCQLLPLYNF